VPCMRGVIFCSSLDPSPGAFWSFEVPEKSLHILAPQSHCAKVGELEVKIDCPAHARELPHHHRQA
jgi:hypothetical protein